MDDAISRKGVSAWLNNMGYPNLAKIVMDKWRFPAAEPDAEYWRELCKSYRETIQRLMAQINKRDAIICCKDCKWWTKQEDSLQGRCTLLQMYPTGEWFCGNTQR